MSERIQTSHFKPCSYYISQAIQYQSLSSNHCNEKQLQYKLRNGDRTVVHPRSSPKQPVAQMAVIKTPDKINSYKLYNIAQTIWTDG